MDETIDEANKGWGKRVVVRRCDQNVKVNGPRRSGNLLEARTANVKGSATRSVYWRAKRPFLQLEMSSQSRLAISLLTFLAVGS